MATSAESSEAKAGYYVVGIGRGPENGALAKKLGTATYVVLTMQ